uniref:Canalicular multispecific organic anion transporter 1-like n=1 Tax=Sinocyclocheilus rhinocerous TaxID=307959 RepID=A0A673LNP5_9TELE
LLEDYLLPIFISLPHSRVCVCVCQNASYLQRPDPDLPICVEQTVLVWLPLAFLWLCAPWHFANLCKKAAKAPLSKLYICKQVKCSHAKRFVFSVRRRPRAVDSGSLFVFWLLQVLCAIFQFQTLLRDALNKVLNVCFFSSQSALHYMFGSFQSHLTRTYYWRYRRPLVQEDMWDLNEKDSSQAICQGFEDIMAIELKKARSSLQKKRNKPKTKDGHQNGLAKGVSQDVLVMVKKKKKKKEKKDSESEYPNSWLVPTIAKTFKGVLLESAFFKLIQDLLSFASPQLLKLMISFTQDKSSQAWTGYLYAVLLLVVAFLQSVILQQYFQRCFILGMKVRTALMAAVYKKALVVSNDSRKESTAGEIVNLMSADAQRFNDVTNFIHLLWSCPLQIALAIAFLWIELGPSVLAGLLVMVLMVPINGWLATKSRGFQMENMKFKDKRMKIVNDILNGIKVLKYYAWESSFEAQVQEIREQELKVMRKFAYLSSVSTFIFSCAPAIVSLATFAVFVSVSPNNILDAEKAFTSISLFNILRFPLAMLPQLISIMVQTAVSKKRLEKFLSGDDLDTMAIARDDSHMIILFSVSLDIKPGRLVAVVGAVGSGKTSLISALLGELHSLKGRINIKGSVAFVPQQAWIQNATLKDNVLFGSDVNEERYRSVVEGCALGPDLDLLPGRDQTEIGEKGINLSGGQKQRVSLARAVYSSADVYLLDDPLSAVDSHVGKHLFERVIGPKGLLKDKTRILVTHGISFLPYVDEIVVLVNGVVSEVGSYDGLRASKGAFSEFLETYGKDESTTTDFIAGVHFCMHQDCFIYIFFVFSVSLRKSSSVRSKKDSDDKKGQRLIEKEAMETGRVKFSVYLQYLRSMGWCLVTWSFLFYFIQNVAIIGQNLWLSDWTDDSVKYFNTTYPNHIRDTRIGVFGALGVAQGFLVFLGTILLADGSISASRSLHTSLLSNILKVPMVFFDTTPSGRIVNRFAKDIFTVDEMIPMSFRSWILCLLGVLGTLFVICLATPIFTAVVVPMAVIYYFVQRFYVATSRQLRRLDSVSRSPIYSHFGETVSGLSVIRAYGHQQRFLKQNEDTIDQNLKSVYPWIVSNRWLAMRLESLGNLVVFFSALFAVISRDSLNSGLVGLSISYALNVTQTLNWLVRMTSELETNIVAVERVREYAEIKNEAPWITTNRPPDDWPTDGNINFENYKVRYRPELELILHGITCDIQSTEKIGIVGRTGAGKSSLTNCLFRIIEASEGQILVDGIDISTLGLHDLRSRLTIIPQDPVLFSGTLRMNLDPFEKSSDEEIWTVLELAHLKDYVRGLPTGLQHVVSEGGENLSVGQRQLLCLARALLRKSRILILDEATAAVDLETDDLIQNTIRTEFSHCTVLTIAHRLNTILDSSRVMVLDSGKIVEFDSPSVLLNNKQGHFYAMAKDAGIRGGETSKPTNMSTDL